MAPRISEVTVIPSWAPESSKERLRSEARMRRADRSPSSARRSTLLRSTATRANSAATKNPVSRMSRTTAPNPR